MNIYEYRNYFEKELMGSVWTDVKARQLEPILSQDFQFLAQGSTSRAYVSKDGLYCLKVFLKSSMRSKKFRQIPFLQDLADLRRRLRMKVKRIEGQINAYQFIPEETGMIYYQFHKPRNLFHKTVNLIEKDGAVTVFDLDKEEFVIQRKAVLCSDYLRSCFEAHDEARAKEAITKLLRFTKSLYNQGLVVYCLQFLDNFGFIENDPVRIDVEHLRYDPTCNGRVIST